MIRIVTVSLGLLLGLFASSQVASAQWFNLSRPTVHDEDNSDADPVELTDQAPKPRLFGSMPHWSWNPKPIEWRQPELFRRMGENTVRAWDTTRQTLGRWASTARDSIRTTTYNTWSVITRSGKTDENGTHDNSHLSPSTSRVNDFLSQPRLKF